jgi:hypothetical protein
MSVQIKHFISIVLLIGAALLLGGCAGKGASESSATEREKSTGTVSESSQMVSPEAAAVDRLISLREASEKLSAATRDIDVQTIEGHRRDMARAFQRLADVLGTLDAGAETGAVRLRIRELRSSASRLEGGPETLPVEAIVDTGVWSGYSALVDTRNRQFAGASAIGQTLAAAGETADQLDDYRGPLHWAIAARTMRQLADVVAQMTAELYLRQGPATEPRDTRAAQVIMPISRG